jgi:hypothetical protein
MKVPCPTYKKSTLWIGILLSNNSTILLFPQLE